MDRGYPAIFLLMLGFSAAAEGNPWRAEERAKAEIEAWLAAAPESG
jgi:hypothetical protein